VNSIIRYLKRIKSWGPRPLGIFERWVDYLEVVANALPSELMKSGSITPADVDQSNLAKRIEPIIRACGIENEVEDPLPHYVAATAILMEAVYNRPISDYLGAVYSLYAASKNSSRYPGEFYTSSEVAQLQAMLAGTNYHDLLKEHLLEATVAAVEALPENGVKIVGQGLAGLTSGSREAIDHVFQIKILPLIAPYVKPIQVYDPSCGSGTLLLGVARQFPAWANQLGFVQYFGQDLSILAVRLTRLNCRMFGLNDWCVTLPIICPK
jgi:hypothetical protein